MVQRRAPRSDATVDDPALAALWARASGFVPLIPGETSRLESPLPGLHVLRHHRPTAFEATVYDPMLCLILQGKKQMRIGARDLRVGAGECALVSHDIPMDSRVLEAPYLVVLLGIRLDVLRGLYEDLGELASATERARAVEVHRADPPLLDAVSRYLACARSATDTRVLAPALLREVHYRLLQSPLGDMLRGLAHAESHASGIARAIAILRRDFRAKIVVEDLARTVGMSVSAFHKHFKSVTTSSPLQYQKHLRLLEARRALVSGRGNVGTVAFDVGYESASQFSREYTRAFGKPPSQATKG